MKDETKTKEELIKELQQLRRQVTRLEKSEHERKKAEGASRISEERSNKFMNSATEAISIYDSEFNLIDCNDARMKMYYPGLKKEDVVGKNVLELILDLRGTDRYTRMQ